MPQARAGSSAEQQEEDPGYAPATAPQQPNQRAQRTDPIDECDAPLPEPAAAILKRARDGVPSDEELESLLQSVFRHDGFRGQQLRVIQRVLTGQSTLAVLPTGCAHFMALPFALHAADCIVHIWGCNPGQRLTTQLAIMFSVIKWDGAH